MLQILMKTADTVIQGGSDMGARLSEDELQQALDFCGKLLIPTTPEQHRATERILADGLKGQATDNSDLENPNPRFTDVRAPIIHPQTIETVVLERLGSTPSLQFDAGCGELDMKMVLEKVNARRAMLPEHRGIHNFEGEPLGQSSTWGGWVPRLEKGKLGLVAVRC
jgi:hypothetical protein